MTTTTATLPTNDAMLTAIRAVKLAQAQKIGAMCVANQSAAATALDMVALTTETGILAGLDLASETLKANLG